MSASRRASRSGSRNHEALDLKLKALVRLSKINSDPRRAAVAFYLLIRREVNEKGILLGFAPLISEKKRNAFEYMNAINSMMEASFGFSLFDNNLISKVQKNEILFLRNPGSFSFNSLKELITIYYSLRKLEVPTLYRSLETGDSPLISSTRKILAMNAKDLEGMFSNRRQEDPVVHFFSLDLEEKDRLARARLKQGYDKACFERLLQIKTLRSELSQRGTSKIFFKGALRDHPLYQRSLDETPGFFLLGVAVAFIMVAILLFIQDVARPEISGAFTLIALALMGTSLSCILIYWKVFYTEVRLNK